MRHAPDPRLLLEVALVQLTHEAAGADLHSLLSTARAPRADGRRRGVTAPAATRRAPVDPATGRATLGGRARRERRGPPTARAAPPAPAPASTPRARPAGRRSSRGTAAPAAHPPQPAPQLRHRRQPDRRRCVETQRPPGAARHGQGDLHGRSRRRDVGRTRCVISFAGEPHRVARRGVPPRRRAGARRGRRSRRSRCRWWSITAGDPRRQRRAD